MISSILMPSLGINPPYCFASGLNISGLPKRFLILAYSGLEKECGLWLGMISRPPSILQKDDLFRCWFHCHTYSTTHLVRKLENVRLFDNRQVRAVVLDVKHDEVNLERMLAAHVR
jgi:hypothetical protein